MLNKNAAWEIALKYSDEVRKTLEPDKIILFGSYVSGVPCDESDIDIAVIINGFDGDWYETEVLLYAIRRRVKCFDIEPHLLDENRDPSGFAEHVVKTGEIIYQSA
jgi:predicted nucleotidyltransferase